MTSIPQNAVRRSLALLWLALALLVAAPANARDAPAAIMAGDSLRSDVHPALDAGAWAAFIPQEGAWVHETAATPADQPRFRQLHRLADLPAWIDAIG
jgi:FMN phosphatase YigB (HAD superfamily)